MSTSKSEIVSSFIKGAPPGELEDVIADIKALTAEDSQWIESLRPALKDYNEEQLTTVKLPGGNEPVIVSAYNALEDNRYFNVENESSFAYDHVTHKASTPRSYTLDGSNIDIVKSLSIALSRHADEHFPDAAHGVYPRNDNDKPSVAILLVSNKYSPANFWSGRWRTAVVYSPTKSSLTGQIKVDVHYYEDGNVRLLATKPIDISLSSEASANEIIRQIATVEKSYQAELNRAFGRLSEGAFKSLRRQLPVSRQKIKWENVGVYRLGQNMARAGSG